jgi:hypothetical protein
MGTTTDLVSSVSNALRTRIVKYVSEKKPVHTGSSRMRILGMISTKMKMKESDIDRPLLIEGHMSPT